LSLLVKAVRQEGIKMPVGGKLTTEEIAAVEKWVNLGAPWPEEKPASPAKAGAPGFYERIKKEHWAFQPLHKSQPVETANGSHPVDAFIVTAQTVNLSSAERV
jgi:hypothetical protein